MRSELALGAVALAVIVAYAGCGESGGGSRTTVAVQINMTNLVGECQKLAEESARQRKDFWDSTDTLPPTIASLSPQHVEVSIREWATVVDIQTMGGFNHRGYLVVCSSKDPNFVPQKGRNWRITKVAPAVFEYRE